MKNLIGERFGRLVINEYYGNYKWKCSCDCGETTIVSTTNLENSTKSCGCLNKELVVIRNRNNRKYTKTVEYKGSRIINIWKHMNQRCTNKNHSRYKDYGGRGISVCYRWSNKNPKGFENFLEDMKECPIGKSLDRINNNKLKNSYSPKNCRWATPKQQANNRRNNLDKKSLAIRKYDRKLQSSLNYLIHGGKSKINSSKYFSYNSKQLYDHLENIRKSQNNCCPICHIPYNINKFDIDHIIPTSSAKTKEELLKLFNLDNLSLLCYKCNRWVKRNKITIDNFK
jgi:hypothetical protein